MHKYYCKIGRQHNVQSYSCQTSKVFAIDERWSGTEAGLLKELLNAWQQQ